MGQLWDTTSHIFSHILGHTSLKFTLSLISGHWVYVVYKFQNGRELLTQQVNFKLRVKNTPISTHSIMSRKRIFRY